MRLHIPDFLLVALVGAAAAGCEPRAAEEASGFAFEEPATAQPTVLLRVDTVTGSPQGTWMDVDVLVPAVGSEAASRATLQHVIDSVAAADTLVVAIRAAGFRMGPVNAETGTASIEPFMLGLWGPPDSVWVVGRQRAKYRTHFTMLRQTGTEAPPGSR